MKKPATTTPDRARQELLLVFQIAASISIASFFFYLQKSDLLLYGDAVAHINIARRVFDSRTPGLWQLGTVWLPLPHLLMMPFLASRFLWRTGIGGSILSMLAYVISVVGIYRLVRTVFASPSGGENEFSAQADARVAAFLAAAIFALNPNLLYLQTTAMTEPLYLALFIWGVTFFAQALRRCGKGESAPANRCLRWSGLCVLGACLTRYDGWLLAAVMAVLILALAWARKFAGLRPGAKKFILLAAVGPALWLAYNAAIYRNPLEFVNGPYSAKAIEQRTAVPGMPAHPGDHDLRTAFKYYFKSVELNLAPGRLQVFWVTTLLFGTAVVVLFQRKLWPVLLLWIPVPFYMLSVAYSGVPIFLPVWWPHSYYNLRYGLEMLPAIAVFTAMTGYGLSKFAASPKLRTGVAALLVIFPLASYALVWRAGAVSLEEALNNSRSRMFMERQLASLLSTVPANATVLMYLGDHVGALQQAGIPLAQTINEGNHRPWVKPDDAEGLWERALAHPASYADFAIAFDHDSVACGVNKAELKALTILRVSGQPEAVIYQTVKSNQPR
jgi:hypothetical protein